MHDSGRGADILVLVEEASRANHRPHLPRDRWSQAGARCFEAMLRDHR